MVNILKTTRKDNGYYIFRGQFIIYSMINLILKIIFVLFVIDKLTEKIIMLIESQNKLSEMKVLYSDIKVSWIMDIVIILFISMFILLMLRGLLYLSRYDFRKSSKDKMLDEVSKKGRMIDDKLKDIDKDNIYRDIILIKESYILLGEIRFIENNLGNLSKHKKEIMNIRYSKMRLLENELKRLLKNRKLEVVIPSDETNRQNFYNRMKNSIMTIFKRLQ